MSQAVQTLPGNIKWIALQDLLRRRTEELEHKRLRLHFSGLLVALIAPMAPIIGSVTAKHAGHVTSGAVLGLLAIAGLSIEFVAQLLRQRLTKMHAISRRVLAIVLPFDAAGCVPSAQEWTHLLDQCDISEREVMSWGGEKYQHNRFEKWWASERPRGGNGRLSAVLLDNVIWTQTLLNKLARRRVTQRLYVFTSLVIILFSTAVATPRGLSTLVEFLLVPLLLFALSANGLTTTDFEVLADAADELSAIHENLQGLDLRKDRDTLLLALLGRYFCLTSAIPPLPTKLYHHEMEQLNLRITHGALEQHLSGT